MKEEYVDNIREPRFVSLDPNQSARAQLKDIRNGDVVQMRLKYGEKIETRRAIVMDGGERIIFFNEGLEPGECTALLEGEYSVTDNGGLLVRRARGKIGITEPWGKEDQSNFLNAVIEIQTDYSAPDLLLQLKNIERSIGRKMNAERWSSRPIDLDILLYGLLVFKDRELTIPHEFLTLRKFMLEPLYELCPDLIIPKLDMDIGQALKRCTDNKSVWIFQKEWLI